MSWCTMRICNIPRVTSSRSAQWQETTSRIRWGTLITHVLDRRHHKIQRTHGWILNLSSRGLTLWSYLSPTTAFNPIGAMMLLSVRPCAESSPPSPPLERCCGDAEIRHCVTAPPSHALVLPSAVIPEAQTQNHKWIHPWFHADCSRHYQWRLWNTLATVSAVT